MWAGRGRLLGHKTDPQTAAGSSYGKAAALMASLFHHEPRLGFLSAIMVAARSVPTGQILSEVK